MSPQGFPTLQTLQQGPVPSPQAAINGVDAVIKISGSTRMMRQARRPIIESAVIISPQEFALELLHRVVFADTRNDAFPNAFWNGVLPFGIAGLWI